MKQTMMDTIVQEKNTESALNTIMAECKLSHGSVLNYYAHMQNICRTKIANVILHFDPYQDYIHLSPEGNWIYTSWIWNSVPNLFPDLPNKNTVYISGFRLHDDFIEFLSTLILLKQMHYKKIQFKLTEDKLRERKRMYAMAKKHYPHWPSIFMSMCIAEEKLRYNIYSMSDQRLMPLFYSFFHDTSWPSTFVRFPTSGQPLGKIIAVCSSHHRYSDLLPLMFSMEYLYLHIDSILNLILYNPDGIPTIKRYT